MKTIKKNKAKPKLKMGYNDFSRIYNLQI